MYLSDKDRQLCNGCGDAGLPVSSLKAKHSALLGKARAKQLRSEAPQAGAKDAARQLMARPAMTL